MTNPIEIASMAAVLAPFSGAAQELVKSFASGIAILYEPTRIRRRSAAEREAELEQARIEVQQEIIKARGEGAIAELRAQAAARQELMRLEYELNFQQVIAIANENIEPEERTHCIKSDWAAAFQTASETAADTELQELWGRVLAGEIKVPGSFSIRAIHFLKGVSKQEADIFTRFCSIAFYDTHGFFVPNDYEASKQFVTFKEFGHLESIGLIKMGIGLWPPEPNATFAYGDRAVTFNGLQGTKGKHYLNVDYLSALGIEIAKLVRCEKNNEYLDSLIASPNLHAKEIIVQGTVTQTDKNIITVIPQPVNKNI